MQLMSISSEKISEMSVFAWELQGKIQNGPKGTSREPMITRRTPSYSQDTPLNSLCEHIFTRCTPCYSLVRLVFIRIALQNNSANIRYILMEISE